MAKKTKNKKLPSQTDKDSLIVTSRQIINGWHKGVSSSRLWALYPIQTLSKCDKTEEWKRWNLDWFERIAHHDLSKEWKGIQKDYDLAEGILNPEDYGVQSEEFGDYIKDIIDETQAAMPAMFFPIIPPIVNLFVGEYIKRDNRMIVKGVDEYTMSEKIKFKNDELLNILIQKAQADIAAKYEQMENSNTQEVQEQFQQEMKQAEELVQLENRFKTYQTRAEQWSNRMIEWDDLRFGLKEKTALSLRDYIVSDKTFWHIRQLIDDIKPELWNPKYTFYHKCPDKRYISETNYAGRQIPMSLSEILENYEEYLTEEDYIWLEYSHRLNSYSGEQQLVNLAAGVDYGDNSKWTDYTKPYPFNITDVTYEKALAHERIKKEVSIQEQLLKSNKNSSAELDDYLKNDLFRVTEVYWRSYKKQGTLTRISPLGGVEMDVIDEDYIVTEKPVYDTTLSDKKTKENLISGEHIDWYWKLEIRFGVKISKSILHSTPVGSYGNSIYLSGDPIDIQINVLPVEGIIGSDRNATTSTSIVRKLSPYQICFNIVNNQNIDMLANNLANGKVIMIDQNYIPKKSFDGSWGKHAMQKWLEVIRNNNIALMDGSPVNNPSGSGFSHFQVLDFSNTPDILRNIQLGEYYKNMAFSIIGITPQRLGVVSASESATGVQTAQINSYAQTEYIFERHANELMPRVRQLMLNFEQYLASTKPEVRIAYCNSEEENTMFEIQGEELLLPELKLYVQSTSDIKALVEKMHNVAMQINTAGAEMSDYMKILSTNSPSKIVEQLEKAETERKEAEEATRKHEQEMLDKQLAAQQEELQKQLEREDYWKDREDKTKRYIAEINELGGIQTDANANSELDSLENIKEYNKQKNIDRDFSLKEKEYAENKTLKSKEMLLKEKELVTRNALKEKELQIAKENKNQYDK